MPGPVLRAVLMFPNIPACGELWDNTVVACLHGAKGRGGKETGDRRWAAET